MKFSVLLPTRNRLDLLTYAVETVRRQDYDNWEIIISDNFSEDDIAGYVRSLNDPRIKYYRTNGFIPVTDNWNNALGKSDGDYVIMLGDDDCLMKGYFSAICDLTAKYRNPDVVSTNAYLYAYPGVLPSHPDGFLKLYPPAFSSRAKEPFFLDKHRAMKLLQYSADFKVRFNYNMQFFTISRRLIRSLEKYGAFFQSPYPEYYAANALLLKAERVLIAPQPLVTIGISPKSFGFYYFNDVERLGTDFLKNLPDAELNRSLEKILLPGTNMNTSWLLAMQMIQNNFGHEIDIKINYQRYRLLQIFSVYRNLSLRKSDADSIWRELWQKLCFSEKLRYGIFLKILLAIFAVFPLRVRVLAIKIAMASLRTYPWSFPITQPGHYKTILEVFERIDPASMGATHSSR